MIFSPKSSFDKTISIEMLFLFLILFFNYSIQKEILTDEKKLNEELVVCPFKFHVPCNLHTTHFHCFCYVSPTSPSMDLMNPCDEIFDIKFPDYNTMEFKISSEHFRGYNWEDFDHEIGLIFEDSTSANLTNFLFVRKYCDGKDIVVQAIRLDKKTKIKGKNSGITGPDLAHIRGTMLDVVEFNNRENGLNYKLKDIKIVSLQFIKTLC